MSKSFKQPADRTPAEQDEYDIHRFYQRKNKAEASGKTYKPRFTGNIKRLFEQYPEQFTEFTGKPVAKVANSKEVEEQLKSQAATIKFLKERLESQENLTTLFNRQSKEYSDSQQRQAQRVIDTQAKESAKKDKQIAKLERQLSTSKANERKGYQSKAKEQLLSQEVIKARFKGLEQQLAYYQELAASK